MDIIYQVNHFLAAELDVVLLQEILYSISNFYACVLSLFWSNEDAQSCAGDSTAKESNIRNFSFKAQKRANFFVKKLRFS